MRLRGFVDKSSLQKIQDMAAIANNQPMPEENVGKILAIHFRANLEGSYHFSFGFGNGKSHTLRDFLFIKI
jgi:hypothetical protein